MAAVGGVSSVGTSGGIDQHKNFLRMVPLDPPKKLCEIFTIYKLHPDLGENLGGSYQKYTYTFYPTPTTTKTEDFLAREGHSITAKGPRVELKFEEEFRRADTNARVSQRSGLIMLSLEKPLPENPTPEDLAKAEVKSITFSLSLDGKSPLQSIDGKYRPFNNKETAEALKALLSHTVSVSSGVDNVPEDRFAPSFSRFIEPIKAQIEAKISAAYK